MTIVASVAPGAVTHHPVAPMVVVIVDRVRPGNPHHDVGAKRHGAKDKKSQSQCSGQFLHERPPRFILKSRQGFFYC
jgi:hypothetical protein